MGRVTLTDSVTAPLPRRCEVCDRKFLARRRSAKTCSVACRQQLSRRLRTATPPLPVGPFDLILADPAWRFATYSAKGKDKCPDRHYATMSLDTICRLPVSKIAAPDSLLALWIYGPLLLEVGRVMAAWGFEYASDLFHWFKLTAVGKRAFGTGYYTRKGCEQMLLGKRGRGLAVLDHGVSQVICAPRREHSRKPDEAYEALERLFGPVRRIELFARHHRDGWTPWGNEASEDPVRVNVGPRDED
jgi:N6-adenosine-specific RNA methylase IME4